MKRTLILAAILAVCVPGAADEPEYEMAEFQFVQLLRPHDLRDAGEEAERLQQEHLAFLKSLNDDGRALAIGPIVDDTLRGIVILDVGSVEAAEELMQQDPWIRRGNLHAEVHSWWAAKGILRKPPVFADIESCFLGLLKRPVDAPDFTDEELEELQAGHMANMKEMTASGDLVIAGPMGDDTELRGILVFRTQDRERVAELVARDPSIQANRLEVELYEWYLSKGTLPPPD